MKIPFNKPFLTGNETLYIEQAVLSGKISGNGLFTKKCQRYFEKTYGFKKCLLTTSCTDALEMCAILADIKEGDEVIIPSYTFVSTALPFIRQGAKVVFADSYTDNPNIDADLIEELINPKTKAIVPVHYAGVACDMTKIMHIAEKYNLIVIEDAAQAIDNFHIDNMGKKKALGSIGHLAAFSFHETKNIISGEGGMLTINDERFLARAEIIWEKGTNRSAFFRGEIDKYGWVDTGSSFLPSEIVSAFLWAQIENIAFIQDKRKKLWNKYYELFSQGSYEDIELPQIPAYSGNNAHMFYITVVNSQKRDKIIKSLKDRNILAVFHYISLHSSPYYKDKHDGRDLVNSDRFTNSLLRLPFFYDLTEDEVELIVEIILHT
jgi:dTDP-4-amino-4,6-dideoxygalactose transaminase